MPAKRKISKPNRVPSGWRIKKDLIARARRYALEHPLQPPVPHVVEEALEQYLKGKGY